MKDETVVDRNTRLEIEHVFIYNLSPEINDFEKDIAMVINKRDIDSLIHKCFWGGSNGCILYSCNISAEEGEELNLQTKYQPHHVFSKLLEKKVLNPNIHGKIIFRITFQKAQNL